MKFVAVFAGLDDGAGAKAVPVSLGSSGAGRLECVATVCVYLLDGCHIVFEPAKPIESLATELFGQTKPIGRYFPTASIIKISRRGGGIEGIGVDCGVKCFVIRVRINWREL
jgi:hypothetical protein